MDDPLSTKATQSRYWLQRDAFECSRNRFFSLAQCISVSRANVLLFWTLGDVTTFKHSKELPSMGNFDMDVTYMLQNEGKAVKVSRDHKDSHKDFVS